MMYDGNILVDDLRVSTNLKQKQKRKAPTKVLKKSTLRNERKVPRCEDIAEPDNFMKFETFQLERTSTPNHINLCEHCKHSHAKECCMYVYDDHSDIMKYSSFKHSVEEPYYIVDNDENFHMKIGRTTPKHFPTFTENDSSLAATKKVSTKNINNNQQPIVYLRQYMWPFYVPQYHHLVQNDQYLYNLQNFVYYPHLNVPPPIPYMTNCFMKQYPMPIEPNYHSNNYRNCYNPHPLECNNYVPMSYNNYWL